MIIGLIVLFGFLVVFLSMYTEVFERTREIGVLKAQGSIAGILMRFGTRWLIATIIPSAMTQDIVPEWWPIAGGITLVSALFGVLYPAMKAERQDALGSFSYD